MKEKDKLYWSKGNKKVQVPVLSVGASLDCPNKETCPYSKENFRASGKPWCYAQKIESLRSGVLARRRLNEKIIRKGIPSSEIRQLGADIARFCWKKQVKFVRFNEASDLADWNMPFLEDLTRALRRHSITPYLYSKSSERMMEILRIVGAVVLKSDVDFVCVRSVKEAKDLGLKLCPGEGCGVSCLRCPLGLKTAVLAH